MQSMHKKKIVQKQLVEIIVFCKIASIKKIKKSVAEFNFPIILEFNRPLTNVIALRNIHYEN